MPARLSSAKTEILSSHEPIAIIGLGCRFPGDADSPEAYWKLMCDGVNAVRTIPTDRWSIERFYDKKPATAGRSVSKWGGFVRDIDKFDANFFGISPREADWMDPQQRLLLEVCTRALEDAGQDMEALRGSMTGVFAGISTTDYADLQVSPMDDMSPDVYSATGRALSIAANRISYAFDLRGPSVAMDTACSSSLTGLHFACGSLWRGDCRMALCAGVNLLLSPGPFISFSQMGMLSPTGRCQAFDSRANGFVRGEGAGAVLLKPLSAALADGDEVYAVIRATGANQDGRTNGITVPSPQAQEALVRETCKAAGLKTTEIHYVEAHGTGTPVGDPLEANALGAALGGGRTEKNPLLIGSVKTNLGHLESAAGIAGLVKLALVLKHREIPANLNFRKPNKHIDLAKLHLRVVAKRTKLPASGPIYAGINSFGFGGANAHAVLESAPEAIYAKKATKAKTAPKRDLPLVLPLSARSADALKKAAEEFRAYLAKSKDDVVDIARAAALRRSAHPHRLLIHGQEKRDLLRELATFAKGGSSAQFVSGQVEGGAVDGPVFVCSGQGPQWWGMGRELIATNAVFRAKIEECDRLFREFGTWSLLRELSRDEKSSRMDDTAIAQPAIFAIQVALAAVWESLGVRPVAVVGHSVGEVAAAHITGVFTLREAARVIFYRGDCMSHASNHGRMLAAGLSAGDAEALLASYEGRAVLGAVNGPSSVSLSGDADALEELAATLEARGIFNRFLQVKYAFHSHHMDPVRRELAKCLGTVKTTRATLPLYSTVSGEASDGREFGASYWWKNVRQPVRFAEAIEALIAAGHRHFLELSAHPALVGSINECFKKAGVNGTAVASLRRKEPELRQLFTALGVLHGAGVRVDWTRHFPEPRTTPWPRLPLHPWMRDTHWHEPPSTREGRVGTAPHPLLDRTTGSARPLWLTYLNPSILRWLPDHRVGGHTVFPGAGYIETAIAVAHDQFGKDVPLRIDEFTFEKALFLPEGKQAVHYQTHYAREDRRITISSRGSHEEKEWSLNAKARLYPAPYDTPPPPVDLKEIRRRCDGLEFTNEQIYGNQNAAAVTCGPFFQGIDRIWCSGNEALGRLVVPDVLQKDGVERYWFHPAFLDGCFHVQGWSGDVRAKSKIPVYLPVSIRRLRVFGRPGRVMWCHVRCTSLEEVAVVYDLQIYDEKGNVLADFEHFRCQSTSTPKISVGDSGDDWLYIQKWKRAPLPDTAPPADAAAFFPKRLTLRDAKPTEEEIHATQELRAGLAAYVKQPDDESWRALLGRFPRAGAEITALRSACIDGRVSNTLLEEIEQDGFIRGRLNREIAQALHTFLENVPADRLTRVLEHGGGHGGLATYLRPRLSEHGTAYTFTGTDEARLNAAEKKLFGHANVKTRLLDLGGRVAGAGKHDVLILHVPDALTPVMLENVKRLAAPGALVLLITPCAAPLWARKILSLPEKSRTDRAALLRSLTKSGMEGVKALSAAPAWNPAVYELLTARMPGAVRAKATAPKRAAKPSTWLLIADEGGFAPKLAAKLEARGDEVLQLTAADSKAAFLQVLTSARRQARYRVAGVVFLRALDFASNDGLDEKRLKEAEKAVCHATMNLVQALTERAGATLPSLWLVTRGVARVQEAETPRIAAAALTGLARTIAGEYMMLRSGLVDLTPDGDDETDALNLTHEMTAAENTEGEVAWRGHTRFVGRLVHTALEDQGPARALPPEDRAQRVEITTAGVIDQLSHFTVARRAPAKGEVEVEIRAAALNFRDVMKALGIYPSENALDQLLGDECAGIVTRVGPGVRRFKAGDAVLASGLGLFSSHATLPEVAVMPKPTNITFEDAVTLPVTFMTAYYALHTLGHIKKGDKVLVQAGTGGVGLAAIQLAKLAGAEVYATAGSEEKRSFLRALGVAHVADSRSISFADDIRAATGGRGVDLVLNSLAGPAIEAGIACLAPYGRFLEIGKRDIYADSPVGLRPFRNNLSLHVIDMGQVMLERPEFVIELLDPVMKLIRSGKLHPLPSRAVPAAQAVNAFRAMSAAKHIGKIVLSMDGTPIRSRERMKDRSANFDPKGSYLITGGLGGFGLALAELMVHGGARHLVLTGRSGASRPEAVKGVEKLRALGARVTVLALDVTSRAAVHEAVKRCGSRLRGVLHAAAVLDDGILMHMTPERFERVMAPKVAGTWHLHEATLGLDLEVFVLFSSVAALVGSGGQGNYSAANTFMDTFAHYRRSLGLTALSVNWGAITDVGLAARDKKVIANLQASGITGITPFQAGRILRRMVTTDAPQLGFLRMDWQVRKSLAGNRGVPPRFEELVQASANDEKGKAEARAAVLAAPPGQRPAVVLHHVREIVAGVLRTSAAKLENERPLKEMGLDSLMAFELLLRVEQGFGISLPPTKLSAGGNIKKLAEVVQGMVTGGAGAGGAGSAASGSAGATQGSQSADGPAPDCLVPLRSEGSQPPLFIIHGAGGLLDNVEPLMAALPKTLPVYGLQSRAHADERGEHATLEAAARDYARLIHAQQPEGALRIAGFSAGGFFALAAAHELEKLGRKVALVGLLDTAVELLDPSTSRLDFEQRHLVEMHRYLAHDLGVIPALPNAQVHELSARLSAAVASVPQAQRALAKRKWLAENAGMPMVEEGTYLDRFLRLFELHWQFMAEIRPVSLSAPVHVWLAVPPGEKRVMPDQVKQLSRSAVQTTLLTGHHYEIMNPPAVKTLARQIAAALRRAGEK